METRSVRHPVDLGAAYDGFLDAQDAVVPKAEGRGRFLDPGHCPFNEEFRWRRALWLALLDGTRRGGVWCYRVSDCSEDLDWLEVASAHPSAERITTDALARAVAQADWRTLLGRVRHA